MKAEERRKEWEDNDGIQEIKERKYEYNVGKVKKKEK